MFMKVIYKGNYRANAVFYRGVTFIKGEATEVSTEWYERNKDYVSIPKAKRKTKVSDGNND